MAFCSCSRCRRDAGQYKTFAQNDTDGSVDRVNGTASAACHISPYGIYLNERIKFCTFMATAEFCEVRPDSECFSAFHLRRKHWCCKFCGQFYFAILHQQRDSPLPGYGGCLSVYRTFRIDYETPVNSISWMLPYMITEPLKRWPQGRMFWKT